MTKERYVFLFILLSVFFFLNCKSSVNVKRNVRVHFDKKLYVLPYERAKENIGFDDPNVGKAFAMVKVTKELEDNLIKEIKRIFIEKNVFKKVKDVKDRKSSVKEKNVWFFKLKNKIIRTDKIGLNLYVWIVSEISITDSPGASIFTKTYKVHDKLAFTELEDVTYEVYEILIKKLINDLEVEIAGLNPYKKGLKDKQKAHPGNKGEFWL